MNKLIDDIVGAILNKSDMQKFEVDVLVDSLKGGIFNIKNPMEMSFKDGKKTVITTDDLYLWIKHYKSSPTKCKDLKEYEQKLLAIKI